MWVGRWYEYVESGIEKRFSSYYYIIMTYAELLADYNTILHVGWCRPAERHSRRHRLRFHTHTHVTDAALFVHQVFHRRYIRFIIKFIADTIKLWNAVAARNTIINSGQQKEAEHVEDVNHILRVLMILARQNNPNKIIHIHC